MYLRAAKTEAEEAGVETEGMANSVSSLRNELRSLTGIDIMLDDSTFKSTYQILEEIAGVWDSLSDISRSNVLNLLGGKRNANIISSLIANFEDAEAAMESAMNSMGSAAAENEKYLDSINGRIAIFKASFEELSMAVVDTDLVKFVVDFGTAILNALTQVATFMEKLGGLKTALIAVAGALVILKGNMIALTVTQTVVTLFTKVRSAISNIIGIIPNAITAWRTYSAGIVSANTAMQASIPVVGLALAAISAVVAGVSYFSSKQEEASQKLIEEANEITAAYSEASDEYKSNVKTLHSLKEEFERLSAGVDENGNNVSLTADEYERYLSIIDQLVDISPDIVKRYDSERGAIVDYKEALDDAIEAQEKLLENQRRITLTNGETIISAAKTELKNARSGMDKWYSNVFEDVIDSNWPGRSDGRHEGIYGEGGLLETILRRRDLGGKYAADGGVGEFYDSLIELYKRRDEVLAYMRSAKKDSGKVDEDGDAIFVPLYNDEQIEAMQMRLDQVGVIYDEMVAAEAKIVDWYDLWAQDRGVYSGIPESAFSAVKEGIASIYDPDDMEKSKENIRAYFEGVQQAFTSDSVKSLELMAANVKNGTVPIEEYDAAVQAYLETLGEGNILLPMMSAYLTGLASAFTGNANAADEAAQQYTGLVDALKRLSDGYSLLETAKKEMAEGSLSLDTVKKIADALGDGELLTDYIYEENGALKLNTDAWIQRSEAIAAADKAYLEKQKAELEYLKEQNALVEQYEGLTYDQIVDSAGSDTANAVMMAREYVSDHVADLATLDEQLAHTTGMIDIYDIALRDAGSGDDPLNLSSMISSLDSVGSKAKGLLSVLTELENGTAMSEGEIAALALQYEELFGVSPEFDLTTLEGQRAAIQAVVDALEAEYDATIDTQIAALEAAKTKEGITNEEIAAIDTKIARLKTLKGLTLDDLYGENNSEDDKVKNTTKRYSELSDAISAVSKAQKLLNDIESGDGDQLSMLQSVIDILQDTSAKDLNIEDFISGFSDIEGIQWNEEAIRAWSDSIVDSIPGIDELDEKYPGLKQHLKDLAAAHTNLKLI